MWMWSSWVATVVSVAVNQWKRVTGRQGDIWVMILSCPPLSSVSVILSRLLPLCNPSQLLSSLQAGLNHSLSFFAATNPSPFNFPFSSSSAPPLCHNFYLKPIPPFSSQTIFFWWATHILLALLHVSQIILCLASFSSPCLLRLILQFNLLFLFLHCTGATTPPLISVCLWLPLTLFPPSFPSNLPSLRLHTKSNHLQICRHTFSALFIFGGKMRLEQFPKAVKCKGTIYFLRDCDAKYFLYWLRSGNEPQDWGARG